jgi:hypothetical protein
MNIRKKYKDVLHKIEHVCAEFDTIKSDNLMKIVKMTKLKELFNVIDFWDKFEPNADRPYNILNTDSEDDKGNGTHWVSVFQDNKTIYLYDSFGRKNIMKRFCDEMNELGYRCEYVNKKGDQENLQVNCGLRSLLWLLFVQRYGIQQEKKERFKLTCEYSYNTDFDRTLETFLEYHFQFANHQYSILRIESTNV